MRRAHQLPVALCVWLAILPAPAFAQGVAKSLDELRLLTRVGESVTITDVGGRDASGKIVSLSATSIQLQVSGQRREWKDGEIATIRQRRSDSLGNGALWGLGIGAGLATVGVLAADYEENDFGWAVLAIGIYGGIGAGIGVGVDALIRTTQVIYERPATTASRWQLTPIVSPRAQGARLTLRF